MVVVVDLPDPFLGMGARIPVRFYKVSRRKTRAGEVYPQRTVDTLYRSVSPGDSTGADSAGVYRARVGVNVTTDEEKHKDKYQRWVR